MDYIHLSINENKIKEYFNSLEYLKLKVLVAINDALNDSQEINLYDLSNLRLCDERKLIAVIKDFKSNI